MDYQEARQQFGRRLQALRTERGLTQEQLAEALDKSVEHVSYLERGERAPSFETLFDLADALQTNVRELLDAPPADVEALTDALEVAPLNARLPELAQPTPAVQQQRQPDLQRLDISLRGLRDMQQLADEYGIHDILQDNGGKVLQVLILLGLKMLPGREGNDAIDADGNEYELKTVNISGKPGAGITTHHHLNLDILDKYRRVKAWYIALYKGIELQEIYRISPAELEPVFAQWEQKIRGTGQQLNNPKIPMRLVKAGQKVYPVPASTQAAAPTGG